MLKLGSDTNSLVNHMMSRMTVGAPEPEVGQGATILCWTDRHAATVVDWDGKVVTVQQDTATRADTNGLSESQAYTYSRNSKGRVVRFMRDKNGAWREASPNEKGRMVLSKSGGNGLILGRREEYYDFSF